MRQQILDLIRERGEVSFEEITRQVPGFKGEYALTHPKFLNAIVWPEISKDGGNALFSLIRDGLIYGYQPRTGWVYLVDNGIPNFPVLHAFADVAEPHWVPLVFDCKPPSKLEDLTVLVEGVDGNLAWGGYKAPRIQIAPEV